jgi:hypothetical protein
MSGYTNLVFYIKSSTTAIGNDTLSFMLSNGANYDRGNGSGTYITNNLGTFRTVNFTPSSGTTTAVAGYRRIEIPLANFTGLVRTAVTGWAIRVNTFNGCTEAANFEYQFAIDNISLEK